LKVSVAERIGDFPSPTLLVDGIDVMTGSVGAQHVQACRLDMPTVSRVLDAMRKALLTVGVTSSRIAEISPAARQVHMAILNHFAVTGQALRIESELLGELHDHDVIRLDERGDIRAAYPFSGVPTPHVVQIHDGPTVFAMCAIDALGMAAMLGRDITIASTDVLSGQQVRVEIFQDHASWVPDTAAVFVGSEYAGTQDCCTTAAADRCCEVMNFFASAENAEAWAAEHPDVDGVVLTKEQALRLGVDIFGRLLHD
ncbi:MAG TPA: hypothetical protein DGG94_22175, partial [Micromonosporaceae bacterium]|nr:hypothetical protein [Micromonosporaceae bacterium]